MRPFNLAEALAGKPVQTRSGVPVTELKHFTGVPQNQPCIVGVLEGVVIYWLADGLFFRGPSFLCDKDLVMVTTKKSYFYNVWERTGCFLGKYHFFTGPFSSKEVAESQKTCSTGAGKGRTYVKTIEIETEE